MKFDIIVSNPPYNRGLYHKFTVGLNVCLKDGGCACYIVPNRWRYHQNKYKEEAIFEQEVEPFIDKINVWENEKDIFDINLGDGISVYSYIKGVKSNKHISYYSKQKLIKTEEVESSYIIKEDTKSDIYISDFIRTCATYKMFKRNILCDKLKLQKDYYNSILNTVIETVTRKNSERSPLWKKGGLSTDLANSEPISVNFGTFRLEQFFDVSVTKGDIKPGKNVEDGDVPFVSANDTNNGIAAYIDKAGDGKAVQFQGNKITIGLFCTAFYQPDSFFAAAHGRLFVLTPKFRLTELVGNFITTIINTRYKDQYNYNNFLTATKIKDLEILLPIDSQGEPDWQYMEGYMKEIMDDCEKELDELLRLEEDKNKEIRKEAEDE